MERRNYREFTQDKGNDSEHRDGTKGDEGVKERRKECEAKEIRKKTRQFSTEWG